MTKANNETPDSKEWIASKLYFCSLYFVTVGVLYLWGYWPTFGVNILEYLDLADIIKVTAYPVAITLVIIVIGMFGGDHLSKAPLARLDAKFERVKAHAESTLSLAESNRFKQSLLRYYRILMAIYFSAAALGAYLFIVGSRHAWTLLPIVITMAAARSLSKHKLMTERFADEDTRLWVAMVITATCAFSHGFGRTASLKIVEGTSYRYVISDFPAQPEKNIGQKLRYVGHAGEFIFFYDPVRSATVISKSQDDKPLVLKSYVQPIQLYSAQDVKNGVRDATRIFR